MDVRKKLVEIIQNSVGGCARHWAEIIADSLIANGVTVQEWISVEDRLPDDENHRVLAACVGDYPIGYPRIDTDRYTRGHWVRYGNDVTHWMPVPQPPKGE